MIDVEKQIEEVMELVQELINAQSSSQRIREKKALEVKLRTLLSSAQSGEQVPFGYVNTNTGQFFKDVEPCRKNNEGHWRTVYAAPAPEMEVERGLAIARGAKEVFCKKCEMMALSNCGSTSGCPVSNIYASQPNGEAANG